MTAKRTLVLRLIIPFFFFSGLVSCDYARMKDDEAVNTYETSVPEMPQKTLPVTGGLEVLKGKNPKDLRSPLPFTQASVQQGKRGYGYYCIQCHGKETDGNGTVGQSFAPLPTDLRGSYVQRQNDGELFYKISFGYRRHPPLADTVAEEDRWAIIHYLRSLVREAG